MQDIKTLIKKREALDKEILNAHELNVGKFYSFEHFTGEVRFYHITTVKSIEMYTGTVVKWGDVLGITKNDYIPTSIILQEAKEISEEAFMNSYNAVMQNL